MAARSSIAPNILGNVADRRDLKSPRLGQWGNDSDRPVISCSEIIIVRQESKKRYVQFCPLPFVGLRFRFVQTTHGARNTSQSTAQAPPAANAWSKSRRKSASSATRTEPRFYAFEYEMGRDLQLSHEPPDPFGERFDEAVAQRRAKAPINSIIRSNALMKLKKTRQQVGTAGYILLWLLGIPVPILLIIYLLRGCT